MGFPHVRNHRFFRTSLATRPNHDGGAMSIVGTYKHTPLTPQLLKSHPDVRLDVLHQMPNVNVAVGVGQRCCDEDLSSHARGWG